MLRARIHVHESQILSSCGEGHALDQGTEAPSTALASQTGANYDARMIIIRFADSESERRGLGYLAGRFSFKSWASGETMVPDAALPYLAREGIRFSVEGPASYERQLPAFRDPAAPAI